MWALFLPLPGHPTCYLMICDPVLLGGLPVYPIPLTQWCLSQLRLISSIYFHPQQTSLYYPLLTFYVTGEICPQHRAQQLSKYVTFFSLCRNSLFLDSSNQNLSYNLIRFSMEMSTQYKFIKYLTISHLWSLCSCLFQTEWGWVSCLSWCHSNPSFCPLKCVTVFGEFG